MINLIIFSRDRALQLHGLLSSLKKNCDIFAKTTIIYKYSDNDFSKGYDLLIAEYKDVNFVKQRGLKDDVLECLSMSYTCFMVDDLIAYNKAPVSIVFHKALYNLGNDWACFSLRLGSNINHSPRYMLKEIFAWNWSEHTKYWGNPISLDGHIYCTKDIKEVLKSKQFDNPNKLEIALLSYKDTAPRFMSCFNQSIVVSIPINRVSETASASYGEKYPHTAKELNDRFLKGERMDWSAMDYSDIKMPHQEIELKFKK